MDQLYTDLKKARIAGKKKPEHFANHLAAAAPVWAEAIERGELTPKLAKQVTGWAVKNDLVEVLKWIEPALDFGKNFVNCAFSNGAFQALRWAGDRIDCKVTPLWRIRHLIAVAEGRGCVEDLQWIADNMEPRPRDWGTGMYGAAKMGHTLAIEFALARGASWSQGSADNLLKSGSIEAIRHFDLPVARFTSRCRALTCSVMSGSIPSIEWVLAKFFPTGDFDVRDIIDAAVDQGHLSVLRWLHEVRGYSADVFRPSEPYPDNLMFEAWGFLDVAKWLQELCGYTREELIEANFFQTLRQTNWVRCPHPQFLRWAQKTYRFTAADVRESGVLGMRWTGDHKTLQWIIRTFELAAEDFSVTLVTRLITGGQLKALKVFHQKFPIDPAVLLAVAPSLLTTVVRDLDAQMLEWLHEIGFRSNDPTLPFEALYGEHTANLEVLRVLHDRFGIDRCLIGKNCILDAGNLKVLHNSFGVTLQDILPGILCNDLRLTEDTPEILNVLLDTYGASCRELRDMILSERWPSAGVLLSLRDILGMSAERWRDDGHAALRRQLVEFPGWGGTGFIQKLFEIYDLHVTDIDALLEHPDITEELARRLRTVRRRLSKQRTP